MKKSIILIFFELLIFQSCSKDVGPLELENNPTQNVKFATDVQAIFNNQCISCHNSSDDLNLETGNSYNNLVNVNATSYNGKRVVAGDAENSVLYKKIDGSGAYGSNMPLGGNLSATQINTIKQWIVEGALNN